MLWVGSRKKWLLITAGLAGVVVAVVMWCQARQEPSYNGRSLKEWVDSSAWFDRELSIEENEHRRQEAVRAMDEQAVPFLARRLRPSRTATFYYALWKKAPLSVKEFLPMPKRHPAGGPVEAARLLRALGPSAKAAVPELVAATESGGENARLQAALALGATGIQSRAVTAALLRLTQDTNITLQFGGAYALWTSGVERDVNLRTIEAILTNGQSERAVLRAAEHLGEAGPEARALVSALEANFRKPLRLVTRIHLAEALWRIAGNTNAALGLLEEIQSVLKDPPVLPPSPFPLFTPDFDLLMFADRLSDVPEVRDVVRPHVQRLVNSTNVFVASMAQASLRRLDRKESPSRQSQGR